MGRRSSRPRWRALYAVAYTLKFTAKMGPLQVDYPVMALEGLWWTEPEVTSGADFTTTDRSTWRWTLMIMQPDLVTAEMVGEAAEKARKKKELPALEKLRFERFAEGTAVQIMHIGPYAEEVPTIQRLHVFAKEQGYTLRGSTTRSTSPTRGGPRRRS